jgi:ADP-ribose pyrophosphatase
VDDYSRMRRTRPDLFVNSEGGVEILPPEEDAARRVGGPAGVVYADAYITVLRDPVRFPDGRLGTYLRVLSSTESQGTVVLPLLDAQVILVEHFRHATRSWHLEAPRGFGEPGAHRRQDAARELGEELGAVATELIDLGTVHPDTGLLGHSVHLWAARVPHIGEPEHAEGIRRAVPLTAEAAEAMVLDGRITDAFTVAVLARARLAGLLDTES